jgi:ABC-type nickel/cobalt efflux system permease component RcnA
VIAARFDAFAVGCLAVVAMGLGTAVFNQMIATSGVATRRLIGLGARDTKGMQAISATLHLTVGFMIIAISIGMLLP